MACGAAYVFDPPVAESVQVWVVVVWLFLSNATIMREPAGTLTPEVITTLSPELWVFVPMLAKVTSHQHEGTLVCVEYGDRATQANG
jgi:hypothetical protein